MDAFSKGPDDKTSSRFRELVGRLISWGTHLRRVFPCMAIAKANCSALQIVRAMAKPRVSWSFRASGQIANHKFQVERHDASAKKNMSRRMGRTLAGCVDPRDCPRADRRKRLAGCSVASWLHEPQVRLF